MKPTSLLIAFAVQCVSAHAQSHISVEGGRETSQSCAECYGFSGKALVSIQPNLAVQNAVYLELSLDAYRAQTRKDPLAETTYFVAAGSSDNDAEYIAAYYSQIKT
jgi:cytochrome c553